MNTEGAFRMHRSCLATCPLVEAGQLVTESAEGGPDCPGGVAEVRSRMHQPCARLCLFGLGFLALDARAQPPTPSRAPANGRVACDALVKVRPGDPLSYRQRGDRCEGVYAQDVASRSSLLVASVMESFEAIDDTSSLPLRVEWTSPNGEAVRLRAYSIRSGLYYRMETAQPIAASPYLWPPGVLQALRIGNADIGVTGSTFPALNGVRSEVLVPLRIRPSQDASSLVDLPCHRMAERRVERCLRHGRHSG